MIFGILKDSSRKFNNLPLINYFSYRNVLQNGAKALSKMVLKNSSFCQKHHNFLYFGPYVWREFSLPVSAFATVALKSSNCKFTAKIHFPIGHFMLPLLTLTLKV